MISMMKKISVGILLFMLTLYLQQGEAEASKLVITATQDRVPIIIIKTVNLRKWASCVG